MSRSREAGMGRLDPVPLLKPNIARQAPAEQRRKAKTRGQKTADWDEGFFCMIEPAARTTRAAAGSTLPFQH
jgi:hypothetical protein